MLVAAFAFALMGVCVKFASEHYNAMELVAYRGLVSIVIMFFWARSLGVSLKTQRVGMHAWRGIIGAISLLAWFYALQHLPLATAMTLNYMSSVWIAAFLVGGALMFGRADQQGAQNSLLFATVLAGFGGVVLVLRPAFEANQLWAGLIGMMSGVTAALAYLQVTALSRAGEPEARVVFYFAVASLILGAAGMAFTGYSAWSTRHAIWIVPIGLLASIGQLCMTRAYASGATMLVANLQYSGIVFAATLGMIVFGDQLPLTAWLGMAVIIASGIAATILRNRTIPNTPPEEH
ncbi:DMT family transporter [Variovorax sp. PCZ-1]|nr:DMT family transporter [Variovorax sp. PCZ-1]